MVNGLVLVDVVLCYEKEGNVCIWDFMLGNIDGFGLFEEVVDVVVEYLLYCDKLCSFEGLKRNLCL